MATQASDTSSKTRARGSSDELAVIAQRAQAFTNASGAAIALSEGSSDELICRARSGATSPEVGTPLRVEGSFTGLCIQSGKELRCDDAETDTRVDTTAIRAIGIRSLVVTPIKEDNRVAGVLMVFAPTAHAFTITHVAVLKTMSDQISALLQRERKAREEGGVAHPPEPTRPPASVPVAMPKPVASAPVLPAPVVIKSSTPAAAAPRTAAFPVVSKVEPIKTADEFAIQAPLIKREEKRVEPRHEHRASLGTLDAVALEGKRNNNRLMTGVAAVLLVVAAAAGTFAYRKLHKPRAAAAQQAANPGSPALTGQPAGAAPGAAANIAPSGTQPGAGVAPAVPVAPTEAENSAKSKAAATEAARKAERQAAARDKNPPPAKPTPETIAFAAGTSRLGANGASNAGSANIVPVLTVGTGRTPGTLSALTAPAASSTPSTIAQSQLDPIVVLKKVNAVYPAIARARRLSGVVTVQFVVSKTGRPTNLQFISGPPVFRDATFEAARQWRFKPAKLNGQPIEQTEQIRFNFTP